MYSRNKSGPRTEPCGTPHKVVSVYLTWSTLSPSSSFEEAPADSQMADNKPPSLKRTKPREYCLIPPKNERRTLLGKDFKITISDAFEKSTEMNSFLDDVPEGS